MRAAAWNGGEHIGERKRAYAPIAPYGPHDAIRRIARKACRMRHRRIGRPIHHHSIHEATHEKNHLFRIMRIVLRWLQRQLPAGCRLQLPTANMRKRCK